jgi:hypothetical protein
MNVYLVDESHVAVIEQRPTGFGPSVWVGELRTSDDKPIAERAATYGTVEPSAHGRHYCHPLSIGTSEGEVLALLVARARAIKAAA